MKTITLIFLALAMPLLIMSQTTTSLDDVNKLKDDVKALQKKDKNIAWQLNQFVKSDKMELDVLKTKLQEQADQLKALNDSVQRLQTKLGESNVHCGTVEAGVIGLKSMFLIGFILILFLIVVLFSFLWLKIMAKKKYIALLENKVLTEMSQMKSGFENQLSHLKMEMEAKMDMLHKQ